MLFNSFEYLSMLDDGEYGGYLKVPPIAIDSKIYPALLFDEEESEKDDLSISVMYVSPVASQELDRAYTEFILQYDDTSFLYESSNKIIEHMVIYQNERSKQISTISIT